MVSELIERLASKDAGVRRAAADELHGAGAAAVPLMIETVRMLGPSPQYALLMEVLGRMGRVAFDPVCAALAAAQTRDERRTFARVFGRLGESALPGYVSALDHPSLVVRHAAIAGIGGLKEAGLPAAPVIAAMLGHADKQVRDAASRALAGMGGAVIPLLQDIRAAGPGRARPAALYCLAEIGGETALSSRDRQAVERLIRVKLATDHPVPVTCCFLSWIAVATSDQQQVMRLFGLTPAWPATFPLGIAAADRDGHGPYDGPGHYARVFVTPPLDGWTLLIGPWCDPADEERRGEVLERCVRASAVYGRAQAYYFATQGDGSAWLVAENGTLVRRGASIGDALDEEIALGPPLPYEAEVLAAEPDEFWRCIALSGFAPVLAARLSIDPLTLSAQTPRQGHGWIALTPTGATHGAPPGALKF